MNNANIQGALSTLLHSTRRSVNTIANALWLYTEFSNKWARALGGMVGPNLSRTVYNLNGRSDPMQIRNRSY